jgi:hypothetical protein
MMELHRTNALFLVLAALALAACSHAAPPSSSHAFGPALAGLRVVVVGNAEGGSPDDCPALAGVGFALLGGLNLEPAAKPVLSVAVGCEPGLATAATASHGLDETSPTNVSSTVTLDLAAAGQPDESYEGAGLAQCAACEEGRGRGALVMTVAHAVRDALDLALAQNRVSSLEDGALAALLANPDREARSVLLAALDEAGIRRLRTALEPAARLLDAADDEIALRSVGVLSRLEESASVKALGKAALTRRPEVPFAAVRAIADIDGPDARRALELVAGQAQDPVLAREASELLDELVKEGQD